jgi:hypothetical protein
MPAITEKEVIVFSSIEEGVLGIYDSFKSLYDKGMKRSLKKRLPFTQEELIIKLLNHGEYSFGKYKLELRKADENFN